MRFCSLTSVMYPLPDLTVMIYKSKIAQNLLQQKHPFTVFNLKL